MTGVSTASFDVPGSKFIVASKRLRSARRPPMVKFVGGADVRSNMPAKRSNPHYLIDIFALITFQSHTRRWRADNTRTPRRAASVTA